MYKASDAIFLVLEISKCHNTIYVFFEVPQAHLTRECFMKASLMTRVVARAEEEVAVAVE